LAGVYYKFTPMIHRMRNILLISLSLLAFIFPTCVMSQADFTASETSGCTPMHIKFTIDETTVDLDTVASIDWYFGFGDTITSLNPDTVIYENDGLYTVTMVVNGNLSSPIIKTDFILIHRTVSAVFRFEEYASNFNYRFIPLDEITDSLATYFYMWRYNEITGTDTRANDKIVNIDNQEMAIDSVTLDTGVYRIALRVEDTHGCISQFERLVEVVTQIKLPNVFAPETQDFYIIDPNNINTVLNFQVFNRYGLLVFSQVSPVINWNGKTNSGQDLTTGVYYYVLKSALGDSNARYNQNGFIHLYR
jgi:PKD repeat protein